MIIDISQIIGDRVEELKQTKTVEGKLGDLVEDAILKGFENTLNGYEIRRAIENQLTSQVSQIVGLLNLTTYNSFIAEQMRRIVEDVCKADLQQKIIHTFEGAFIYKQDNIKLSDIFSKYREFVCNNESDENKASRGSFYVKLQREPRYGWYDCELHPKTPSSYRSCHDTDIAFTIHTTCCAEGIGWVGCVYLNGNEVNHTLNFDSLNDVELMLVNAVYNRAPIIIDVDDECDIDNSYDISY